MFRAKIAGILIILMAGWTGVGASSKAEKNFKSLSVEILQNLQEFWPVYSTIMGIHKYDGRFTDYSPGSVENERKTLRKFLARLYKYQGVGLPFDMDIDRRLLRSNCEIAMLNLVEIGYHKIDPNIYVSEAADGIYFILARDYAPLADRLENVIARMRALPRFLEQGENNLHQPPPIWLDHARENIGNVISLYQKASEHLMIQFPDRAVELEGASATAIEALHRFRGFLDNLTPGEPGSFAIGKEYFDYILNHQYFFNFDSDSLLKIGEQLLARTQVAYREFDEKMNAGDPPQEKEVFVPASIGREDVMDYYNWEIETVRRFFKDRDLLTIPDDIGKCLAVETPAFLQGIIGGIAYEPAGPFDSATTGYFYVAPVAEELTAEQRLEYYLEMYDRDFRRWVVHEAFPGHHLQLQLAARAASDVRRWQMSNTLIEGWGLYCEEMAYDAGLYEGNPEAYLRVLGGVAFRAARIIVDVKLQTGQFDYDQAVAWMIETLGSNSNYIKKEVLRYTSDPGQPMSYLMGKQAIVDLRDTIKRRESDSFSLKSFHDRLLAEGSIPVELIREKMTK